jgi:uncharacterized membrane protein
MMERGLRLAVWVSASILAAGLVLWLAGAPRSEFVLDAGLWVLIAVPIVRVVTALVEWAQERDWTFVALTLLVLACLLLPLATALATSR